MRQVLLTDICCPKQWKTLSTKNLKTEGYPVYGANGIIGYYNEYTHGEPTILITCRGATCGTINVCVPKSYVNGNAMALDNLSPEIDLNFLSYYLSHRGLNDVISGSAQPQITRQNLNKVKVPLPPLEEQKKIAAILDAADDYRQKTKALIEKYDHLTQSLFLDMFGDSTNTERTELANTVTDKGHFVDGPFGSNLKVSDQTEKGIRLIQVNNIGVRVFRDKTSRFTSVEKYETLRKHEVIPGDLVVAKMGEPLGRCCILPNHISKALVVADCMRIRVSSPHFISKYVMFFLNSYDAKQQIKNLSRGSTRVRINLSMLRKLKIPKPTLSSQNQFAERVAQIEQQKQQAEASLVKAEELFSSLLQRAFKGELTS